MKLTEFESASDFLDVAESYLQAHESQNSLPLGLALRTRAGTHPADVGTRFFVLEHEGRVAGTVSQTPGQSLLFTDMSKEAAWFAAAELPKRVDPLIGCIGPVEVVDEVASRWQAAGLGTLGILASMGLFELLELTPPRPVPGELRLATEADLELCRLWLQRFQIDCNLPEADPDKLPERVHALEQKRLYLWDVEGQPVACAAWARPQREGITVGYVYTPDELRGRGYASNVVAALTAGLLDGSLYQPARKRVTLYTDLANPTSNSIYQKLGYQPIGDHRHYRFER